MVADTLSQITTCLGPEAIQSILDGATLGTTLPWLKVTRRRKRKYEVTAGQALVEMHVTNWAAAQKEDPELDGVLHWLEAKKKTDLRTLLGEHASSEEGQIVWRNHQNVTVLQDALYLCSIPKGENEDLLLFMVPKAHWTATLNGCHQDAGHQGHDHALSLLKEHF